MPKNFLTPRKRSAQRTVFILALLFGSFILSVLPARGQTTQAQVVQEWIKTQNEKLPAWLKNVPELYLRQSHPFPVRHWDKKLSLGDGVKLGLPEVAPPAKLDLLYEAMVEGQTIVCAKYRISEMNHDTVLFLLQPSGLKPLLELILCSDIGLVQLGPQAPTLIMTRESACVQGNHSDRLYRLQKNGTLQPLVSLAGYHGGWAAFDLNRDSWMEIVDSKALSQYPADLKDKLIEMKVYDGSEKPEIQRYDIYQWKNDKFERVGRYFGHDDLWNKEPVEKKAGAD